MTDDNRYYLGSSRRFHVTAHLTAYMLKGAGIAALACLTLLVIGLVLLWLSDLLPPESKMADDPTPDLSLALPWPEAPVG